MHKHKYYKPPKPSTLSQKPLEKQARPEFTTDFSDPDKYKLSEAQLIQKKASLQSKNRQTARLQLEERRKKLEMGIVDEDTRKIFETALTSKNIDLNPPLRRNLSQMIQYQRSRSVNRNTSKGSASKRKRNADNSEDQHENQAEKQKQCYEQQIKKTQHFIKRLEKAKREDNIEKAVDILTNTNERKQQNSIAATRNKSRVGSSKMLKSLQMDEKRQTSGQNIYNSRMSEMSQEQTLSNIEETIKFMEQKLFNPSKNKKIPIQQKAINEASKITNKKNIQKFEDIKCSTISQISYDSFHNEFLASFSSPRTGNLTIQSDNYQINDQKKKQMNKRPQKIKQQEGEQLNLSEELKIMKLNFQQKTEFNLNKVSSNIQTKLNQQGFFNKNSYTDEYEQEDEDECLSTIRKMKQMMDSKVELYDRKNTKDQKENQQPNIKGYNSVRSYQTFKSEGDVEVDFSLTLNEDQIQKDLQKSSRKSQNQQFQSYGLQKQKLNNKTIENKKTNCYQQLRKSLFEEIDSLQKEIEKKKTNNKPFNLQFANQSDEEEIVQTPPTQYNFGKKPIGFTQVLGRTEIKSINTEPAFNKNFKITNPVGSTKMEIYTNDDYDFQPKPISSQLESLKSLVHGTKNNVNKMKVQKIGIQTQEKDTMKKSITGFDYRGSINIKKHIIPQ